MSDLSDAILNQVVLELKERLDGPAKESFTKLPPSHQREWARYISKSTFIFSMRRSLVSSFLASLI